MSIFDYPRINFKGLISINVGTANNDDYSGDLFMPDSPYAPNQPVRLADSASVQPETYGMDDDTWVKWAVTPLVVATPLHRPIPADKPPPAGSKALTWMQTQTQTPSSPGNGTTTAIWGST